jgi:hypothetical protein
MSIFFIGRWLEINGCFEAAVHIRVTFFLSASA